jgi:hypothetical protein
VNLRLERRDQANETAVFGSDEGRVAMLAPAVGDDYWSYRVVVSEHQAVVGFPKFTTIGIGFAYEDDENTNLPYTFDTDRIWNHIRCNKGDESIPDEWCIEAIRLIQEAATADRTVSQ